MDVCVSESSDAPSVVQQGQGEKAEVAQEKTGEWVSG